MRRLILFRHGKAETAGPNGGDRERPLADRGDVDSAATAAWLAQAGFVPDLVLVSPAVRTRSTWDVAAACFPGARAELRERLYLAGVGTIREVVDDAAATADTVMVVGHNPGLQDLGAQLALEGAAPAAQIDRLEDGFPTASACVFRMRGGMVAGLEAIYEPPRRPGEGPRWQFVELAAEGRT